jgi:hypothetical protein
MNTKTKIYLRCADLFRVRCQDDWRRVSAADLLSVQGCGETFVLKLRLWLAHSGLNLRGDNPAAYWLEVERGAATQEIGELLCPFTIVIDTNEQYPFAFTSIRNKSGDRVQVRTRTRPLYTVGGGDYTIDGMEDLVQLERKGDDLPSSLAQRREAFEGEIRRLSEACEFAAVIVEHPWSFFLRDEHGYGMSGKAIHRTVTAWQVAYPGVHWWFCESRVHAENVAFRLLDCFWRSKQRELSELVRSAAEADPFEAVDFD